MIAEDLKDAEKTYPIEWIEAAMREAVRNNVRNWKYIHAILQRWDLDGFQSNKKPTKTYSGNGHKSNVEKSLDVVREFIAEQGDVTDGN